MKQDCPKRLMVIVQVLVAALVLTACDSPPKTATAPPPEPTVTGTVPSRTQPAGSQEGESASTPAQTLPRPAPAAALPTPPNGLDDTAGTEPDAASVSAESVVSLSLPLARENSLSGYSARGKVDPFNPLVKPEKKEAKAGGPPEEPEPQRILTPLERLDLSQIRLVAVVQTESGSTAMVEEEGGKGYIVKLGTHVGKNNGRVVEIQDDRMIILEEVRDFKGDIVTRTQEMKLHKPENEG